VFFLFHSKKKLSLAYLFIFFGFHAVLASGSENIRLNQIGYYQYGPKRAVIISSGAWRFSIKSVDSSTTYYTGDLKSPKAWSAAGDTSEIADFSDFNLTGTFIIVVPGVGTSFPFIIGASVNQNITRGLIKAFYYQRASTSLPAQYAGSWSRSEGHPDLNVIIHEGAGSDASLVNPRKAGDVFASPKGWYDAGDYGKYVVNAGITVYTLLALYEQFSGYFDTLSLNIPETSSGLPDLLKEIKWEIDWLLTMQDPVDGGVYHKLTSLGFCGFIMPAADNDARYFIGKGSAATFDFAAICAVAYRIYNKRLPFFADSCLAAAKYAWTWGKAHPDSVFSNPSDVSTGAYGDAGLKDERQWAAIELYLATGDTAYKITADSLKQSYSLPSWQTVCGLSSYSLAYKKNDSASIAQMVNNANILGGVIDSSSYRVPISNSFYWGSNSVVANDGMLFIEAFLATKKVRYFDWAVQTLDYLLGKNALGYSFVTGFGIQTPMNPHHRPSAADGISAPVPGLLVGGPNGKQEDVSSCTAYPTKLAAKSWIDVECAYACNEIAINWNAPAAFLAGAIEAIYSDTSYHVQSYIHDTVPPSLGAISITDVAADHVTLGWKTGVEASSSVIYGPDSLLLQSKRIFSTGTTEHSATITGLSSSTRYFFKVSAVDDYGKFTEDSLRFFITDSSMLLSGFTFDPAALKAVAGSDLKIAFTDASGIAATLEYSSGGESGSSSISFVENNGTYSATIPGSDITSSGILFSITLLGSSDTVTTPVWAISPYETVEFSNTIQHSKTYGMVSFPSDFSSEYPATFFGSRLGKSSSWKYCGYSADSGKYIQNDSIRTGCGGWLYSAENAMVVVKGKALKPDTLFPVILSKGWNIIGNPFSYPIYWENAQVRYNNIVLRISDKAANQIVRRQLFRYSDTTSDQLNNGEYVSNIGILSADTTRLLPWLGYWVYAEKSGAELLFNPNVASPKFHGSKKPESSSNEWHIGLSASVNGNVDKAIIGASAGALDVYDEFDSPRPPSITSDVSIGLLEPQWHGAKSLYSSDIISSTSGSCHTWSMAVKTPVSGANVKLSWEKSGTTDEFFYLYDPVTGITIDMTQTHSYDVILTSGETERELSVKVMPYTASVNIIPSSWALSPAAPNPFRTSTKINYSVPIKSSGSISGKAVTLSMYDILGRRVKILVNEVKYPGNYSVVWNGTDDFGKRLKQGIYVLHLSANGFSGSSKIHVVD
jgi:endoglucanase